MTKSEIEMKKLEEQEKTKRQATHYGDRASRRKAFTDLTAAGMKLAGQINDPVWYKQTPGMEDVNTSFSSFAVYGGDDASLNYDSARTKVNAGNPGLYVIQYAPVIGPTLYDYSVDPVFTMFPSGSKRMPINRALNRIGSQLEKRNSRALSYSRDTIGRYFFQAADIAVDILNLKFAIDEFSHARSRYPFINKQMVRARGFNYDEFAQNIAAYKELYVQLVSDFNAGIALPKDLAFVKRYLWMNIHIIRDSASSCAQFYIFHKAVNYHFGCNGSVAEQGDVTLASNYIARSADCRSFSVYKRRIMENLDTMINGADWRDLLRDLRGGIDASNFLQLPAKVDDITVVETDSSEVRNQLHNMRTIPCIDLPETANPSGLSGVNHGLVWSSFSIGGSVDESVEQGAFYGLITGNSFKTALPIAPCLYVYTGTSTSNFLTRVNGSTSNSSHSGAGSGLDFIRYNQYEKYSPDSCLVGTRLLTGFSGNDATVSLTANSALPVDKVHDQTDGDSVSMETNIMVSTAGTYGIAYFFASSVGTEVVLSVTCVADGMEESSSIGGISTITAWATNGSNYSRDGNLPGLATDYTVSNYVQFYHTFVKHAAFWSHVDWAPLVCKNSIPSTSAPVNDRCVIGEVDQYITLDISVIYKLHSQSVQSEWTLPDTYFLKPLQ